MYPIDAVVTWVDGNDLSHIRKREIYQEGGAAKTISSSKEMTRFINNGELKYCLKSLLVNMPWLRQVFIVTDNQTPDFLPKELLNNSKVTVVDHRVVFSGYEGVLPTFNSISIESVLHKIPNLSDHYIYFNDDFMVLQPVEATEFFSGERVVLKGRWQNIQRFGKLRLLVSRMLNVVLKKLFNINRSMSLLQQMKAAELAGFDKKYFKSPHYPHPQKRITIDRFYTEHTNVFFENIKHRFRNLDQHVAIFLSNHLEIKHGSALLTADSDCVMICFNRDSRKKIDHKIELLNTTKKIKFLCIQSLEEASDTHRKRLLDILENKYSLT